MLKFILEMERQRASSPLVVDTVSAMFPTTIPSNSSQLLTTTFSIIIDRWRRGLMVFTSPGARNTRGKPKSIQLLRVLNMQLLTSC